MDYLHPTDMKVIQGEDMFHFGSDTELLGSFMHAKRKDRVLDIGTNNGALLLYASLACPKQLVGIDLFEEVIAIASQNAELNHVDMSLHVCPVQQFQSEPFDLILCNPPYFHTQNNALKNESRFIRAARHEEYLCLDDLFSSVRRLLKSNGRFVMVYRPQDIGTLLNKAETYNLHCTRMRIAYQSMGKPARSVLMEFRFARGRQMAVEPAVFLDDRSTFGWEDRV
ncbi:MAG: tRNA1(Val) (adenine(37)-N6)-methyltransferase [Bulleidia sp.]